MEFCFLWKILCSNNDRKFPRCAHIIRGILLFQHYRGQWALAWPSGLSICLQCFRSRVRVPQPTSYHGSFLTIHDDIYSFVAEHSNVYCHWNFRTFGRMNSHSWVYLYCLSIPTKDKVHFLWIFPYREISILLRFFLEIDP